MLRFLRRKLIALVTGLLRHPATWVVLSLLATLSGAVVALNGTHQPPAALSWLVTDIWWTVSVITFAISSVALAVVTIAQGPLRNRLVLRTKRNMARDLMPVANGVHSVAKGTGKNEATVMKERTLYALKAMLDFDDPRLCLYFLEFTQKKRGDHAEGAEVSLTETLEWDDDCMVGRQNPPRKRTYTRGVNPVSDSNFEVVDAQKSRLVTDWEKEIKNNNRNDLDCDGGGYGGFLVVPVVAGSNVEGVLTVDVPERGLLSKDHVVVAELAGRLLGVALHRLKRNSGRNNPENPLGGSR